ncbi:MAG: hypothetical protein WD472_10625 [Dehalococcoidia bacterium]
MTIQYILSMAVYAVAIGISLIDAWVAIGLCAAITGVYILPPRRPTFVDRHG